MASSSSTTRNILWTDLTTLQIKKRQELRQMVEESLPEEISQKIFSTICTAEKEFLEFQHSIGKWSRWNAILKYGFSAFHYCLMLKSGANQELKKYCIDTGSIDTLFSTSERDLEGLSPTLLKIAQIFRDHKIQNLEFKFNSAPMEWHNEHYFPAVHLVLISEGKFKPFKTYEAALKRTDTVPTAELISEARSHSLAQIQSMLLFDDLYTVYQQGNWIFYINNRKYHGIMPKVSVDLQAASSPATEAHTLAYFQTLIPENMSIESNSEESDDSLDDVEAYNMANFLED